MRRPRTPPLVESARPIYDRLCAALGDRSNTYEFILWAKLMVTPHLSREPEACKRLTLLDMERKVREAEAERDAKALREWPG